MEDGKKDRWRSLATGEDGDMDEDGDMEWRASHRIASYRVFLSKMDPTVDLGVKDLPVPSRRSCTVCAAIRKHPMQPNSMYVRKYGRERGTEERRNGFMQPEVETRS